MKFCEKKYRSIYVKNHPRFGTGVVGMHRFLAYQKYGENLPDCELCGKNLEWNSLCHIDHIDKNPENNNIDNLRPLCNGCNVSRDVVYKGIYGAGTFGNECLIRGFVSVTQAATYAGTTVIKLRHIFNQDKDAAKNILNSAKEKMDCDPNAEKQTAKKRYDIAMSSMGYIRIQGWIRPENKEKVQAFFETKAGLDYESGEHLIKLGEKRAKK